MQNIDPGVTAQLKHTHAYVCTATILRNGQPAVMSNGVVAPPLNVTNGHIVFDSSAAIRASGDFEAIDPTGELTPNLATDLISPFTAELLIERGIIDERTGEAVTAQLGIFRMTKLKMSNTSGGVTFKGSLFDRAARCQSPMPRPWVIAAGTLIEAAIPPLLSSRLSTLQYHFASTGFQLASMRIDAKGSAWDECVKLATSGGFWLYVDRYGVVTLAPSVTTASTVFTWGFTEGDETDFINLDRTVDTDDIPNVIVVVGSNPATPGIRAEAWDADPSSPTYRYGPYGESVRYYDEPRVASQIQAQAMANSLLAENLGPGETVEFDAVPNPWLDVGDSISVTSPRIGLDGRLMVVTKLDVPFDAGLMHVTATRSVLTANENASTLPIIAINAPPPPTQPTELLPDLTVTAITMNPAAPALGDTVHFTATVHNQGTADVPIGTILPVSFAMDGTVIAWNHTYTGGLIAGDSVDITADSGPSNSSVWQATSGGHVVEAAANDLGLLNELNFSNDTFDVAFTVSGTTTLCDLVVQSVSWAPVSPVAGDHVVFSAVIKNQGVGTYDGSVHGPLRVEFAVGATVVTYSASFTGTIAPGGTTTITAQHSTSPITLIQSSVGETTAG